MYHVGVWSLRRTFDEEFNLIQHGSLILFKDNMKMKEDIYTKTKHIFGLEFSTNIHFNSPLKRYVCKMQYNYYYFFSGLGISWLTVEVIS
jgi:hypothetical protein